MIELEYGDYLVSCDVCREADVRSFISEAEAEEWAERRGWEVIDEIRHICPECRG